MMKDQSLKQKWIDALRSGNYFQGNGFLNRNGRHCCLGVLYEVDDVAPIEAVFNSYVNVSSYNSNYRMPSNEDLDNWGISSEEASKLADMNDGSIKEPIRCFLAISLWIEENL